MKLPDFKESISSASPPTEIDDLALKALWFARKGDWDQAHELAQTATGHAGYWVHAYLHRLEGDLSNASYWYRRAGKPPHSGKFAAEWDEIAAELL